MNGLTNAMKFCRKGSITVRLTSRASSLVVEVIDTGIGFDEAMMPQVLQAFTKLDKHSAGAGLGLHITKTMLERAGGSLRLKSKLGQGTTFEAILPVSFAGSTNPPKERPAYVRSSLSEIPNAKVRASNGTFGSPDSHDSVESTEPTTPPEVSSVSFMEAQPSKMHSSHTGTPLRVLVVDDNIVCRKLLARTLRQSQPNLEVQEAGDGQQALKVFDDWSPNLVLTDVCMPVMDGIVSAGKMREREKSTGGSPKSEIYALTALGKTDQRSISMGMNGDASLDGWLIKGEDLTQVVSSIVERMARLQTDKGDTQER
jgi:CheY-like chemotaxis protein